MLIYLPLARDFGMGIVPWSPLAYGLLTGKYDRATVESMPSRAGGLPRNAATGDAKRPYGDKRLDGANPFGDSLFTPRNWKIVDEVKRVSTEIGESPARVALAWVCGRPGITSTAKGSMRVIRDASIELGDGRLCVPPCRWPRRVRVQHRFDFRSQGCSLHWTPESLFGARWVTRAMRDFSALRVSVTSVKRWDSKPRRLATMR